MLFSLLWFLLIGLAAGWLAGRIMKAGTGSWVQNLIVGVIGAVLGGFLFSLVGLGINGSIGELICATVGAVLLLYGLRLARR